MNVILQGIGPYRIRPGDTVVYETPQFQEHRGKVVFSFPAHVTLNIGGKHGRTAVVTDRNFVGVVSPGKGCRGPKGLDRSTTGPLHRNHSETRSAFIVGGQSEERTQI